MNISKLIKQIANKLNTKSMEDPKFKFELGEIVKLKGAGYRTCYVKGVSHMHYLEGHSFNTYLISIDGEKVVLASELELEKVDKKS